MAALQSHAAHGEGEGGEVTLVSSEIKFQHISSVTVTQNNRVIPLSFGTETVETILKRYLCTVSPPHLTKPNPFLHYRMHGEYKGAAWPVRPITSIQPLWGWSLCFCCLTALGGVLSPKLQTRPAQICLIA